MNEKVEGIVNKFPKLNSLFSVVFAGVMVLGAGVASAAIITVLAQSLNIGGTVGEPFTAEITAVSSGTLINSTTVTGANGVAGSAYETVSVNLTNNANQPISKWLEYSCTSPDSSLTSAYVNVQFDGVAPQATCDAGGVAYAYRTALAEVFAPATSQQPVIGYQFPITATGYFTGVYSCQVNVATAKKC
jgi:hypothetical protein